MVIVDVSATLPLESGHGPPFVFVHGAANSALVWKFWQRELASRGTSSFAVNLRGHGGSSVDLSRTSMSDYADDVAALVRQLNEPPILVGWSMGGLVAMMAASAGTAVACVGLASSTPASQLDASVELRSGVFTAEEYGITSDDPRDQPAMPDLDLEERTIALDSLSPESRLARDERRRGVVIDRLPCPLLIVTGSRDEQWPWERYADMRLKADHISIEGASHWGLVLNRRALERCIPAVLDWTQKVSTR